MDIYKSNSIYINKSFLFDNPVVILILNLRIITFTLRNINFWSTLRLNFFHREKKVDTVIHLSQHQTSFTKLEETEVKGVNALKIRLILDRSGKRKFEFKEESIQTILLHENYISLNNKSLFIPKRSYHVSKLSYTITLWKIKKFL